MTKRYLSYLAVSIAVAIPPLLFNTPATADSNKAVACPGEQLDQLHVHWQALITEKDPDDRARLILEHRKLIESAKRAEIAAGAREGDAYQRDVEVYHHDLKNMAQMHSMMLDMIER